MVLSENSLLWWYANEYRATRMSWLCFGYRQYSHTCSGRYSAHSIRTFQSLFFTPLPPCYARFCCFAFSWLMRDGNELSKAHAVSHKNRRRKSTCMILFAVMLTRKLTQNTSMLPKICLDLCNQFIIFPSCNCESFVWHSSKCFASLKIFLCTI